MPNYQGERRRRSLNVFQAEMNENSLNELSAWFHIDYLRRNYKGSFTRWYVYRDTRYDEYWLYIITREIHYVHYLEIQYGDNNFWYPRSVGKSFRMHAINDARRQIPEHSYDYCYSITRLNSLKFWSWVYCLLTGDCDVNFEDSILNNGLFRRWNFEEYDHIC